LDCDCPEPGRSESVLDSNLPGDRKVKPVSPGTFIEPRHAQNRSARSITLFVCV
jgi:hypothetical protein